MFRSRRRLSHSFICFFVCAFSINAWEVTCPLRRGVVSAGLAACVSLSNREKNVAWAVAVLPDQDRECQDGRMAPESAIPGAYQDACMSLPRRIIPIQIAASDDDKKTIVNLVVDQEGAAAGSTGMAVWNSALVLSRLLVRLTLDDATRSAPSWLASCDQVVELGCGVGLGSMTAAVLGARSVLATDGKPAVVQAVAHNVEVNRLQESVQALSLPWGWMDAASYADTADLVLGSDLTYQPANWPALAESMAAIVKPTAGIILYVSLGHAGFDVNAEVSGFLNVAQSQGLRTVEPGQRDWPFAATTTSLSLEQVLLRECMSAEERRMVEASGGVRVLVMRKGRA